MSFETKVADITELIPKIIEQDKRNPILSELLYDRNMPVTVAGVVSYITREDKNTILVMFSANGVPNFDRITDADKIGKFSGGVTCYFNDDAKIEVGTKLMIGKPAVIKGVVRYSTLGSKFRNLRVEQCSIVEPTSPYKTNY